MTVTEPYIKTCQVQVLVGIGLVNVSWPRKEVPRDDLTEPIVPFP